MKQFVAQCFCEIGAFLMISLLHSGAI